MLLGQLFEKVGAFRFLSGLVPFLVLPEDAVWVQHHAQVCKLRGLKSLLVDGLWLDKYCEDRRGT